jgi:hypothetical protein
MQKFSIAALALLAGISLPSGAAQAQTRGGFEIGAEVFDYAYRERDSGETIVFDDGTIGGFRLGYTQRIGGGLFLRARLSAGFGSVDYRAPDPGGDARIRNVDQTIGQLELHLGKDFKIGGASTLTAFAGLGARSLRDGSGGREATDGSLGYDREVNYAYVPVGLEARLPVSKASAILLSAQYNWVVGGDSTSRFSDIDSELPDVELELDRGHGFEASAAFQTKVGSHALSFGPFVRHWKIGRSESFIVANTDDPADQLEFYEPKNRTTELGLRLTFGF